MRTVPVNHSAGPFADGCEPLRLISMTPPGVVAEARTNENVRVASAVRKTDRREHPARRFVFVSLVMTHRLVDLLLPLADKGDESLTIAVNGSLLLDDVDRVIQAALDGAGLAWVTEDRIAEHLESGALIRVLEDWCPRFPGSFLYYPTRKQQPAALTALITTLRLVG